MRILKSGDFTGLASDYSQHHPDYCSAVLNTMIGLINKSISELISWMSVLAQVFGLGWFITPVFYQQQLLSPIKI